MLVKICPKCKTKNDSSAIFCSSCFVPLRSVVPSEELAIEKKVKICPHCGTESSVETVVCPTCFNPIVSVIPTAKRIVDEELVMGLAIKKKIDEELARDEDDENDDDYDSIKGKRTFSQMRVDSFSCPVKKWWYWERPQDTRPYVENIQKMVFESPYVTANSDFITTANKTYFFFNDGKYDKINKDIDIINAFAMNIEDIQEVYKRVKIPTKNYKYAIMYPDGMHKYCTIIAAGLLKFTDIDNFSKGISEDFVEFFYDVSTHTGEVEGEFPDHTDENGEIVYERYESIDNQTMKKLADKYNLFPSSDFDEIMDLSTAATAFTIAHELGHIVNGHRDMCIINDEARVKRNKERAADSFAAKVVSSYEDKDVRKLYFLGGLIQFFALYDEDLEHSSTDSHPCSYERVLNLMLDNKEIAKSYGITKETIDKFVNDYESCKKNAKKSK